MRYPAASNQVASVAESSNRAPSRVFTPWWRVYWPVRIDARDGQHNDWVTSPRRNVTPLATSFCATCGMHELAPDV